MHSNIYKFVLCIIRSSKLGLIGPSKFVVRIIFGKLFLRLKQLKKSQLISYIFNVKNTNK